MFVLPAVVYSLVVVVAPEEHHEVLMGLGLMHELCLSYIFTF
jgi:hypothetical protein